MSPSACTERFRDTRPCGGDGLAEDLADVGVVKVRVGLEYLSAFLARPHHERVHRTLDVAARRRRRRLAASAAARRCRRCRTCRRRRQRTTRRLAAAAADRDAAARLVATAHDASRQYLLCTHK